MPSSPSPSLRPLPQCPWAQWRCPLAKESCSHPQSESCVLLELAQLREHRRELPERSRGEGPWVLLSRREIEVADELIGGKPSSEIAKALHISPHTVRNHLKSMLRKLGVHSQTALVTLLLQAR